MANNVRGPSSALSSFLRERGIAAPPRSVFDRVQLENQNDLNSNEDDLAQQQSSSREIPQPAKAVARKPKKRKISKKEEIIDDLALESSSKTQKKRPLPKQDPLNLTQIRFCGRCKRRFLNLDCSEFCLACQALGSSSRPTSKASKHAAKKREIQAYNLTGESKLIVLPLRDMCINLIAVCDSNPNSPTGMHRRR